MQSNLCSACGGTLPENAAFCPSCGTAQFQTYGATVPSQPPTNYGGNPYLNNPYAPPPPPPSSQPARWKSLGVMGAVSVVLILIIVNALVFIHPTNFLATATSQPGATASATHTNATATAQAVATAAPLLQIYEQATSGTPAIDDPLSDDRNAWGVFTTNWGGQCAFTGGAYHLSLSKPGYLIVCTGGSMGVLTHSANFALQVQINIVQGNNGGVYFGDAPIGSYRIDISSSGAYTLYQYTRSNNQFNLLQSRSSPAIKTGLNQVNVLTAIVHNSNLYLYVNTQFVTSYFLSAYAQGGGGFTALSINQATDVAFSNLKVWTL